jgi:predicted transposase/invertase (TIGR01784 family)
MSREEIKEMLSLELIRGTRFYQELKDEAKEEAKQEVKEELKLEIAKKLLRRGIELQDVADILDVNVEVVRELVNE